MLRPSRWGLHADASMVIQEYQLSGALDSYTSCMEGHPLILSWHSILSHPCHDLQIQRVT